MKKLKYEILFTILIMTIGIAAVTTSNFISGSTSIASDTDDFYVYISDVVENRLSGFADGEFDYFIENEKNISLNFVFDSTDDFASLDFFVTNASLNYDAQLSYNCDYDNEYISITGSISNTIASRSTGGLSLYIYPLKSYIGEDELEVDITCTINASAIERNNQGSGEVSPPLEGNSQGSGGDIGEPPVKSYAIGQEITIGSEKFNVISDNGDTVSMLAQYNLNTFTYNQNTAQVSYEFSSDYGWEYAPGPKEIDVFEWTTIATPLIGDYTSYLSDLIGVNFSGDLITLKQLESLGCVITEDYGTSSNPFDETCVDSPYKSWLINGQNWWTRSACSDYSGLVWTVSSLGLLDEVLYSSENGIRPVITISKVALDYITGGGEKIISFDIEGIEYEAYEGMTWEEWVMSDFNSERLFDEGGGTIFYATEGGLVSFDGLPVSNADFISPGRSYSIEDL